MIEFQNLKKSFGDQVVLNGVDLVIPEGETLSLLGPSGTGKSVLLKHAIGLLTPDEGDVCVDGTSIVHATREELASVLEKYPSQLSGGMRKRVGVARAIASRPRYLLWDEPTTGLDPVNADNIDELILEVSRELRVTSIVVTHDLDTAFEVGDRIALLTE